MEPATVRAKPPEGNLSSCSDMISGGFAPTRTITIYFPAFAGVCAFRRAGPLMGTDGKIAGECGFRMRFIHTHHSLVRSETHPPKDRLFPRRVGWSSLKTPPNKAWIFPHGYSNYRMIGFKTKPGRPQFLPGVRSNNPLPALRSIFYFWVLKGWFPRIRPIPPCWHKNRPLIGWPVSLLAPWMISKHCPV